MTNDENRQFFQRNDENRQFLQSLARDLRTRIKRDLERRGDPADVYPGLWGRTSALLELLDALDEVELRAATISESLDELDSRGRHARRR